MCVVEQGKTKHRRKSLKSNLKSQWNKYKSYNYKTSNRFKDDCHFFFHMYIQYTLMFTSIYFVASMLNEQKKGMLHYINAIATKRALPILGKRIFGIGYKINLKKKHRLVTSTANI